MISLLHFARCRGVRQLVSQCGCMLRIQANCHMHSGMFCLGLAPLQFKCFDRKHITRCLHTTTMSCDRVTSLVTKKAYTNQTDIVKIERDVTDRLRKDILMNAAYHKTVVLARKPWLPQPPETTHLIGRLTAEPDHARQLDLLRSLDSKAFTSLIISVTTARLSVGDRKRLLQLFEDAACARLPSLDLSTILHLVDIFYVSDYEARRYTTALLHSVHVRWRHLEPTATDVVQLLFAVAVQRHAPVELLRCIEAELAMPGFADALTARDFSLVSHAFFASNTAMHNHALLRLIASTVLHDLATTPLYLIVNVMKVFRHAAFSTLAFYVEVGNRVSLHGQSITVVSHFVDAFAGRRIAHDELFAKAAQRLASLDTNRSQKRSTSRPSDSKSRITDSATPLHRARIKDLGRLLWAYASLRHPLPLGSVDATLVVLRQNKPHWRRFPEAFLECLVAMAMNGVYPHDMINFALSEEFIELKAARRLEQHYQLLLLDRAVAIESPDYMGNRIGQANREAILQKDRGSLEHELVYRQGLAAMFVTLVELFSGGGNVVSCHFILDSSKLADLEICLGGPTSNQEEIRLGGPTSNQEELLAFAEKRLRNVVCKTTGESVISELLGSENDPEHSIARPAPRNEYLQHTASKNSEVKERKISVKIMGWNQYTLNKSALLGHSQMELRLLQKLGYDLLVINPRDAAQLDEMTKDESHRFVKESVIDVLGIVLNNADSKLEESQLS